MEAPPELEPKPWPAMEALPKHLRLNCWFTRTTTVCLVGGWVGWVGSNLVFWDGANLKECLVALQIWGQTQPVSVFGWRIGDGAAPFSVWLKEFNVWWTSTRLERLRLPDFDGRVQPASERNILLWRQPNPPILQPNSHGNGFAPLSNQTHGKSRHLSGSEKAAWRGELVRQLVEEAQGWCKVQMARGGGE